MIEPLLTVENLSVRFSTREGTHEAVADVSFKLGERKLLELSRAQLDTVRGREIAIVFQDPLTALNPVLSIGRQITEVLHHHFKLDPAQARARAIGLLRRVGIPDPVLRMRQYPHEFS